MLPNGQSERVAIKRAKQGLNRQALDEYMKEVSLATWSTLLNVCTDCFRRE